MRRLCALVLAVAWGCAKAAPPEAASDAGFAEMPTVSADNSWAPVAPVVAETVSGAPIWLAERPGLPLVSVRVVFPGGAALDGADAPGTAALADEMITRGAAGMTAAEFSEALQQDAIHLDAWTSRTATVVEVDCTRDTLPRALDLMADAILRPTFDPDELERARAQRLQRRREALDEPRWVSAEVAWRAWVGADSPMSHPVQGTLAGIEAITRDLAQSSWATRSHLSGAHWVVVGDVDLDELNPLLEERFGKVESETDPLGMPVPPPPTAGAESARGARLLVDNPGASQTVLRVLLPGWAPDDPERVAGELGVVVLGGTFTSRLNALLREEKGYTYGARATHGTQRGSGVVIASTNVFVDVTGPALTDLVAELERLPEGITEAEAGKAQASKRTDAIETEGSRSGLADSLVNQVIDGLPAGAHIQALTLASRADAAAITRTLDSLSLDAGLVVVTGDLEKVGEAVKAALPGDWVEVTPLGEPVP